MDLLSDVLRDLRLESAVLSTAELRAPWGFDKGAVDAAPFHVIVEGSCFLQCRDDSLIELSQGDLVVLPHGGPHALFSGPAAARVPFKRVLEMNGVSRIWTQGMRIESLDRIRFGGRGALTRVIAGIFTFRDGGQKRLLEALPNVIHVRGHRGRGPAWLESSLSLLLEESALARPGFQTVAERVADILFVQAVRHHIASTSANGSGWIRGLRDPQVAQALSLMHGRPGERWTVSSLAKAVGLSRTVFASRFRALVDSSVMEYVVDQRMRIAAGMLAGSKQPLSKIANEVGYESEISFSKAFRRWAGLPPGRYRRRE